MKKLYLVDVSSMFFRAFYAVRMLTNSQGLPTNAIFGFVSMSLKLLRDIRPEFMVYCFDRPEPSFRKEIDPNYKANRAEMPVELVPQIPYIRRLTELMGIPAVDKMGYEADDIIGTLVEMGKQEKLEVVIVSGDKDFAQLIGERVTMFDPMRDIIYNRQGVIDKWGVTPEQFIDYLAICGDSSDNIPGVRGIGPKGAETLLAQFGSLDAIYQNLDKIKSKSQASKLEEAKDDAYRSQKLVTIVKNVDLGFAINDLCLKPLKRDALGEILDELEFKTMKKSLLGETGTAASADVTAASTPPGQVDRSTIQELSMTPESFAKWLENGSELYVWQDAQLICVGNGQGAIDLTSNPAPYFAELVKKNIKWKGYDIKSVWRRWQIHQGQVSWDHKLAAYLLQPGQIKDFPSILQGYCGTKLSEFPTASEIISAHLDLELALKEKLKEYKMMPILQTLDLPMIEVLATMEAKGIKIDVNFLQQESKDLAAEIEKVQATIFREAGEEFNIASPKQLGAILFEKLKLPTGKKTKTGFSTSEDVLNKLVDEYPIAGMILDIRELTKLKSTYVDALPELADPHSHRIHTDFNQALTTTGRLSSSHPNLQNIPIRTERGQRVRRAFIAEPGQVLLSADYSQIELRVLAHITKDPGLIKAFTEERDIHSWTASEIFGVSVAEVTGDFRRKAKAVNFGIAYGQGVFGLAESLRISRGEAKEIIDNYFKKFPGVREYMNQVVIAAKERGFSETIFGRRRYIPELFVKNQAQRAFGERAAINAPIQGTSSDLVKMAMLEVYDEYADYMLLQVHDELLFEVPVAVAEQVGAHIREIMENVVQLEVPLQVNLAIGLNWAEAH